MSSLPFTSREAYRAIVEDEKDRLTRAQQKRMWAMLDEISMKATLGDPPRGFTSDEWKVIFLHALHQEVKFLPSLDGKSFVPYGLQSSKKLTKAAMSQMIELMHAFAVERGIAFRDDPVDDAR